MGVSVVTLGRHVGSIVILVSVHTAAVLTVIHSYSSLQSPVFLAFKHFFLCLVYCYSAKTVFFKLMNGNYM